LGLGMEWEWELRMENVWGDSIGTLGMGKGMGLRMDIELKCRMCLNSFT